MNNAAMLYGGLGLLLGVMLFVLGFWLSRQAGENSLKNANARAHKILEDAAREGDQHKRQLLLEAKEEALQAKQHLERETARQNNELAGREKRLDERENTLLRKVDLLDKKERDLRRLEKDVQGREAAVGEREVEVDKLRLEQNSRLERIASLTAEEAKNQLIVNMESEARHDAARRVAEIRESAQREAQRESRRIMTLAMQRYAAEHTSETTVSVVHLPGDEMKGRIIGRDRKSTRLNSSHIQKSRMPSSA